MINKSQFLLTSLGIAVLSSAVLLIPTREVVNPDYISLSTARKQFKESHKKNEIAGAIEWYRQTRANQITGTIDTRDVYAAWDAANAMAARDFKKSRAFDNMVWEETGPNNIGGRTRALVVDKNDNNKLYMGSVAGGFWVSVDNGNTWSKRSGNDSSIAMSVCAIAQAANGDIYYGTGEGNTGFAGTQAHVEQLFALGEGIFKSTDGGNTFVQLPATKPLGSNNAVDPWAYVDKLVAHPTNAEVLIAATNGGLKITNNGGTTWTKPANLAVSSRFCDVEISSDGQKVAAATTTGLYISDDGGTTFTANIMGLNGLPAANGNTRVEVAIAPSDKNYVYVCLVNTAGRLRGVYKSTDGGQNFTTIGVGGSIAFDPLGKQGQYDIAFGVHPSNPDLVFLGGQLDLWRYTTATGWSAIAYWVGNPLGGKVVHADMHGVVFSPSNPETMFVITDGGFYRTYNSSNVTPFFSERNKNYSVTQCYGIGANNMGKVVWGSQDNGSGLNGYSANSPLEAKNLTGGDGTRCALSDLTPNFIFTSVVNGDLRRATDGGASSQSFKGFYDHNVDGNDDDLPEGGANWVMPIDFKERMMPNGEKRSAMVIGTDDFIWMTQGAIEGKTLWFQLHSSINSGFSAVTISKDGKTVFAGTASGKLIRLKVPGLLDSVYKYNDTITNTGAFAYTANIQYLQLQNFGRFITDVECDASGNTLVVTMGQWNNSSYVQKSNNALDALPSFNDITSNLPKMPVYSAVSVGGSSTKFILGTELGVWGSDNGGSSWIELNKMNADPLTWHPRCATYEVIQKNRYEKSDGSGYAGPVIYTGTHGRGTFRSTSLANFWPVSVKNIDENLQHLALYPNPSSGNAKIDFESIESESAVIRVISMSGKLVKQIPLNLIQGKNTIDLDLNGLAAGNYIVSLQAKSQKAVSTLVKQ